MCGGERGPDLEETITILSPALPRELFPYPTLQKWLSVHTRAYGVLEKSIYSVMAELYISLCKLTEPRGFGSLKAGMGLKPGFRCVLDQRKPLFNIGKMVVMTWVKMDWIVWWCSDPSLGHLTPKKGQSILQQVCHFVGERKTQYSGSSKKPSLKYFNMYFDGFLELLTPPPIFNRFTQLTELTETQLTEDTQSVK